MKHKLPKKPYKLACILAIQSAIIDAFNKILQEGGMDIKEMDFVTKTLRDIANQLDELIKREGEDDGNR